MHFPFQGAAEEFLKKCKSLSSSSELSENDKFNLQLLSEDLNTYIQGFKYKGWEINRGIGTMAIFEEVWWLIKRALIIKLHYRMSLHMK